MSDPHPPERTEAEKKLLEHAQFAGEILDRLLGAKKKPEKEKPRWQIFLESTGGTALITVVIGGAIAGAVGQWITNSYQQALKERETQVSTYKEYLAQGKDTVTKSYELIGGVISVTDDLMSLMSTRDYDADRHSGAAREAVINLRLDRLTKFTEVTRQWRDDREKLGLFFGYYHDGDKDVIEAWRRVQTVVTSYVACSQILYAKYSSEPNFRATGECDEYRERLYPALDTLTEARLKAAKRISAQR